MKKVLLLILSLLLLASLIATAVLIDAHQRAQLDQTVSDAPTYTRPTGQGTQKEDGTDDAGSATDDTQGSEDFTASQAPDFQIVDAQGKTYGPQDFADKPVVLCFWASWSSASTKTLALYQSAYEQYGEQYHFVMVSRVDGQKETVEKAQAYLETKNYTFPVYFDTEGKAAEAYEVDGLPYTYYLNAEGEVVAYARGAVTEETLARGMEYAKTK